MLEDAFKKTQTRFTVKNSSVYVLLCNILFKRQVKKCQNQMKNPQLQQLFKIQFSVSYPFPFL